MRIGQALQRRTAIGLMVLFLVLAVVPIYMVMAKFATGGQFIQLCTSSGMQTVWVADDNNSTNVTGSFSTSTTASSAKNNADGKMTSPFGCCEFCWTSVLAATVLPLLVVFFSGNAPTRFTLPDYLERNFQSYLRQWHVSSRAPPAVFSI